MLRTHDHALIRCLVHAWPHAYDSASMLPLSDTYSPSKNCGDKVLAISEHSGALSYLPDIFVPDSTDLLNVGGTLRYIFQGVARNLQLILLRLRYFDVNAGLHSYSSDDLFAKEITVIVKTVSWMPRETDSTSQPMVSAI